MPTSSLDRIGANLDAKVRALDFASRGFQLGMPTLDTENRTWVFVKFTAAIAANAVCAVDASFNCSAGTGYTNGPVAAVIGEFGWVRKTVSPL